MLGNNMEAPPMLNDNHSSDKHLVVSDAPMHDEPSPTQRSQSQSPKSQTPLPPPPQPPTTITNDDKSNHRESNIKLKRCKHGRIIIKDLSKKKLVQQSDSNANNISQTLHDDQSLKQKNVSQLGSRQPFTQNLSSQQPAPAKFSPKAAQSESGPKNALSARSPATPDNDDSASSDIYDPEGPIIPMSPGDSPPISPIDDAAFRKRVSFHPNNVDMNGDDDVPSSAVQLNRQEKYLQKLNRQERVIEEVKIALKPFYQNRSIDKEQYKDVLRRAVPKICHSKNGEINPIKIRSLVSAYVRKMR